MFNKVIVLGLAVFALSAAGSPVEKRQTGAMTAGQAAAQCGNNQSVSCCNSADSKGDNDGGLLGLDLLSGLLGGNCQQLSIPIVGVDVPINKACGNNVAACCTGDNNGGLLNIQCNPINIL